MTASWYWFLRRSRYAHVREARSDTRAHAHVNSHKNEKWRYEKHTHTHTRAGWCCLLHKAWIKHRLQCRVVCKKREGEDHHNDAGVWKPPSDQCSTSFCSVCFYISRGWTTRFVTAVLLGRSVCFPLRVELRLKFGCAHMCVWTVGGLLFIISEGYRHSVYVTAG